ncbi:MAG: heme-binding protein [Pseudomonadota bacterium]
MTTITLKQAYTMIEAAFEKGAEMGLKPLTVAVLDAGGHVKALARSDGASNLRPKMAIGKANGCLALGVGGRWVAKNGIDRPHFMTGLIGMDDNGILPVPGGALVLSDGAIVGAVGITGDTSENDETCAVHGIEAAGFSAQVE